MDTLHFDNNFWKDRLPDMGESIKLETRLHLIFSLILFLGVSIQQLLSWLFSTDIPVVVHRVGLFMGYNSTAETEDARFGPSMVFNLWRNPRWPKAQAPIRQMIIPTAYELVLEESDRVIKDPSLQVRIKTLTIQGFRNLLRPEILVEKYRSLAPFMWGILHTFSASPNDYRKRQTRENDRGATEDEDWADDPNANEETDEQQDGTTPSFWDDYKGFSRNPIFVSIA